MSDTSGRASDGPPGICWKKKTMILAICRRLVRAGRSTVLACLVVICLVALSAQPAAATFRTLTTDWHANLGWCSHSGAQLHLGDFNADGGDDMLCHDTKTGYKWVALAKGNGNFTGTDWHANLGWCSHSGAQLHIGDFNRDGRDDMLCHDTKTGYKWVAYGKGTGHFTGTDWHGNMRWCNHSSAQLLIGDFNRDRRDDMLCHDTKTGYKWISNSDL